MTVLLAYFDPSAGSLLLQALVGGFGGIVVVGRYLWMQLTASKSTRVLMSHSQEMMIPAEFRRR